MESLELTKNIVIKSLQLDQKTTSLDRSTQLLGAFPEFNSLTITAIISSIEEELDCDIDDADISAEIFETIGSLARFVEERQ